LAIVLDKTETQTQDVAGLDADRWKQTSSTIAINRSGKDFFTIFSIESRNSRQNLLP
jgi:hypothetical protein